MRRRSLLMGLVGALAAPAIVRAENLMKVAQLRKSIIPPGVYTGRIVGIAMNNAEPGGVVSVMLSSNFPQERRVMSTLERVFTGQLLTFDGLAVRGALL